MAVTVFPVILVNSASGSDSLASGAGPATALTGTAASTDTGTGSSQVVTLDAATDLSGVSTDGSHALYLVDATAGHRRFAAINAKAGSGGATPTVTVEQAFTISLSGKSWAIGGIRASVASSSSKLLFDNNGAAGDAMPGWTIEMQSAHAESLSGSLDLRRAGDTTGGAIVLRGTAAALTRPVLTWSADTSGIVPRGIYQQLRDFELASSAAKGSSSPAINLGALPADGFLASGLVIKTSGTNKWYRGFSSTPSCVITLCEIANTSSDGVTTNGGNINLALTDCYVHDCGGWGVNLASGPFFGVLVQGNLFAANVLGGVLYDNSRGDGLGRGAFRHNDFYNHPSSKDGLKINGTALGLIGTIVENNYFSTNGGYGINFASLTAAAANAYGFSIRNNGFYTNTSSDISITGVDVGSVTAAGPDNVSYGTGGDFGKGSSSTLKAAGFPTANLGAGSSTRSWVDVGAAQRQETAGGGSAGMLFVPGLDGV